MNAPLARRDVAAASGTLQLFALFHLNLAFSSIEEAQREKLKWRTSELAGEPSGQP